jgi:hypothetical protein
MELLNNFIADAVAAVLAFQRATGFPAWVNDHSAVWPVGEILHFVGLCLLIGAVGGFDLRLMGVAKAVPVGALSRLLPWGVLGFVLCAATGTMFVLGNAFAPGEYLRNVAFLWKMAFLGAAGLNLLLFYVSGTARQVQALGAGAETPLLAKAVGGFSLFLWVGVIVFGRLLPTLGDAF